MNAPTHLLESLADPNQADRPPAPREHRQRHPVRTTAKVTAALLGAGILIAAISGRQEAIHYLGDSISEQTTAVITVQTRSVDAPTPTTAAPPAADPAHAAALREVLEKHRAGGDFVGARIALSDVDGSTTEVTSGTATTDPTGPTVDVDVPWNIGSATKPFVAVVVLQLAEEGRLDLDAGIEPYLPDLARADRITPRMLLQHTSGLGEYLRSPVLQGDKQRPWTPDELIAVAEAAGRVSEPGAAHHYSNTNYIVLGEVIQAVTGRSWSDEVQTRIVEPLGLEHTGPVASGDDAPVGYAVVNMTFVDATNIADPSIGGAAGGLQSTGSDLLEFVIAMEDGTLLQAQSRAEMDTFMPAEDLSRFGIEHTYGLGIEQYRNDKVTIIGHMGTGQAQSSFIGFDRETGRAIAVQTNTANPGKSAIMAVESFLAIDALAG